MEPQNWRQKATSESWIQMLNSVVLKPPFPYSPKEYRISNTECWGACEIRWENTTESSHTINVNGMCGGRRGRCMHVYVNLFDVCLNMFRRIPVITLNHLRRKKFSHLLKTGGRAGYRKKSKEWRRINCRLWSQPYPTEENDNLGQAAGLSKSYSGRQSTSGFLKVSYSAQSSFAFHTWWVKESISSPHQSHLQLQVHRAASLCLQFLKAKTQLHSHLYIWKQCRLMIQSSSLMEKSAHLFSS